MTLQVGATAADFTVESTSGTIRFYEWLGTGWCLLLVHKPHSPTCTTEVLALHDLLPSFEVRRTRVLSVASESLAQQATWLEDLREFLGTPPGFAIAADDSLEMARAYDLLEPRAGSTALVRAALLIGPDRIVRATLTYPNTSGRNFREVLRLIDSCQITAARKVATPSDWQPRDAVMLPPSLAQQDAEKAYPRGVRVVRPYLRFVSDPE